jgi:ATP-dependent Clp protease ATP-binding subunit ClpA
MRELNSRLKVKNVEIRLNESALNILCQKGYDPQFGARPLASAFNRWIQRPLSKEILMGNLKEGTYTGDWNGKEMGFKKG